MKLPSKEYLRALVEMAIQREEAEKARIKAEEPTRGRYQGGGSYFDRAPNVGYFGPTSTNHGRRKGKHSVRVNPRRGAVGYKRWLDGDYLD